jgi:L-fucose dehydrogenase
MRFENRVVIVTGGAKGIGLGCVEVFHDEGAKVILLDRDHRSAEEVAATLNHKRHNSAAAYACDVGDLVQLPKTMSLAVNHFDRVDCLINNAGVHPPDTPIEQTTATEVVDLLKVNFVSTYLASMAVIDAIKRTQGTIINISSMTAVLGQKNSCAYAATKGAQLSFTKALALELAPFGVRVNAVLPSNVDTPLMRAWASSLADPQSALQRIAELQPLGRMASPREMGSICLFLATSDSSFITGQGIIADGGASLDY